MAKTNFLMLARNESLARLATSVDTATGVMTIAQPEGDDVVADLTTAPGRDAVESFFTRFAGPAAGGRIRLVSAPGHRFTDIGAPAPALMDCVSLINLASLRALEAALGRSLDKLRFRANIYVDGLPAWSEFDLIDQAVSIGAVTFKAVRRTRRCPATNVTRTRPSGMPICQRRCATISAIVTSASTSPRKRPVRSGPQTPSRSTDPHGGANSCAKNARWFARRTGAAKEGAMQPPRIASGRRATIVTLSHSAGVAPSTISRALRGDPRISLETRDRIARLAKEAGYTPHASARTLSSGRSGLIGVVVGPAENPFYTEVLHEAVRQVADRGMRLLIIHAGAGPVENKTADALLQYQVDGCLMTSVELPSHVASVCAANGVPVVMVNRVAKLHSSTVACDNLAGSVELADLLLRAGHRRIALVRTSSSSSTGRERDLGFTRHLDEHGLAPVLRLDGRSTYEGGFEAGACIAACPSAERPDAVFAVSDIMAFGVMDALRLAGLRVCEDIAVVGFDGLPQSARAIYDLTTVEQPLRAMLGRAMDLLQARMADKSLPDESVFLRGRLIIRGSSRAAV